MSESPATVTNLVDRLRASIARADLARSDDQEAKAFTRLTSEVRKRREQLDDARLLLAGDGQLELTVEESKPLKEALSAARDAGQRALAILKAEPNDLRTGPGWKVFEASAKSLGDQVYELHATAAARLVAQHPRPGSGAAATLVPADPKRLEFSQALAEYDAAVRSRFRSSAEVSAFLRSAERAQALSGEIARRAVPVEHRERWALLVSQRLPLEEVTPGFREWLASQGHLARVFARLDET